MRLYCGDCLEVMPRLIAKESVDLILCDLPYGMTRNAWDSVIPLDKMWAQYWRVLRPRGVVALTAQTPFDKILGVSELKYLRYDWIWHKSHATGHLNSKKMPMREHEHVLIFYRKTPVYNPQFTEKDPSRVRPDSRTKGTSSWGEFGLEPHRDVSTSTAFPRSVIKVNSNTRKATLHPTQKPEALMEYFVRTYTNEGDTVLDNCMGSGTTGVVCRRLGRDFIGIEKDETYFGAAKKRIESCATD